MLDLYICYLTSTVLVKSCSPGGENELNFLLFVREFVAQYLPLLTSPLTNPRHDDFNLSRVVRSTLFLLPFFIRGVRHTRLRVPRRLRADVLALARATDYMPHAWETPSGRLVFALHMPPSHTSARTTCRRLAFSIVAENRFELERVCLYGHEYVARFAFFLARDFERRAEADRKASDSPLGFCPLANLLMDMVLHRQSFLDSRDRRLSILVNSLYGYDGALSFWRIAGLPVAHLWRFSDQGGVELLYQSQIQQLLREGEGS
ncbi:P0 protein [Cotton bunchy top virus 1]|nr:P0 protein [Cotton bunchy top virus 1]